VTVAETVIESLASLNGSVQSTVMNGRIDGRYTYVALTQNA